MGLETEELMKAVELVKFNFAKYTEGEAIVHQNDRCDRVVYVLNGNVCVDRRTDDGNILITEYLSTTPLIIEPQNLWGMRQRFTHSYSFNTEGGTCSIDKGQLCTLIANFNIVRTNLLSLVCNNVQRASMRLCEPIPPTTEDRILRFIQIHTLTQEGRKEFRMKMEVLAGMINATRLNVSRALNQWREMNLLEIRRGSIVIFDVKDLFLSAKQPR